MSQPWLTVSLLFAAFWTFIGAHGTHAALRARRSLGRLGVRGVQTRGEVANSPRRVGTSYHPPQIRYQAPPGLALSTGPAGKMATCSVPSPPPPQSPPE